MSGSGAIVLCPENMYATLPVAGVERIATRLGFADAVVWLSTRDTQLETAALKNMEDWSVGLRTASEACMTELEREWHLLGRYDGGLRDCAHMLDRSWKLFFGVNKFSLRMAKDLDALPDSRHGGCYLADICIMQGAGLICGEVEGRCEVRAASMSRIMLTGQGWMADPIGFESHDLPKLKLVAELRMLYEEIVGPCGVSLVWSC